MLKLCIRKQRSRPSFSDFVFSLSAIHQQESRIDLQREQKEPAFIVIIQSNYNFLGCMQNFLICVFAFVGNFSNCTRSHMNNLVEIYNNFSQQRSLSRFSRAYLYCEANIFNGLAKFLSIPCTYQAAKDIKAL